MRVRSVGLVLGLCVSLIALGVPAHAAVGGLAPRVVGGAPWSIERVPYQVLFEINNEQMCSGALLTPTTVVTAAHCFVGVAPGAVEAWAGITTLDEAAKTKPLRASNVIVHPQYDNRTYANDIALVTLSTPVDISGRAPALIALPVGLDGNAWPARGTPADITGWGKTSEGGKESERLLFATIQVLAGPGQDCGMYGPSFNPATTICAGTENGTIDTCQGDSGGPFTIDVDGRKILAGVVSNGVECASPRYPGIYTRMTAEIPWIQQNADVPVAPPGAATNVTAAMVNGKARVTWTPPAGAGSSATLWTVTASPSGQKCSATGTFCDVAGISAGSTSSFTVQGSNPYGTGPASAPSPSIALANGTGRVGSAISSTKIINWSGIAKSKISALTVSTPRTCMPAGSSLKLTKAGTCKVLVKSGRKSSTVVIAVT